MASAGVAQGLDRCRRAKADERDNRLACSNCIRERGGGVQSTGELSVVAQHHFRGKVVVDVSYPGHDASHSELQKNAGQAERLLPWPNCHLTELAGGQDHVQWDVGGLELVGEERAVGQPEGGEQRVLSNVGAMGGQMHNRRRPGRLGEGTTGRVTSDEGLGAGPDLVQFEHLALGGLQAGTSERRDSNRAFGRPV